MLAGDTILEVGTKVKIIQSNDKDLIGATGKITHPFGGLMAPGVKYQAGLRLDTKGIYSGDICNLTNADKFEVVKED